MTAAQEKLLASAKSSKISKTLSKRPPQIVSEDYPTDWKTIYVLILMSILGMLQGSCVNSLIWPYLQKLVPSSTQTVYAWMVSLSHFCNAVTSIIAGYLSNHFAQTTGALIFDKILAILGCMVFFLIEIFAPLRIALFFICQALFGISGGSGSVGRTQIVMSSREVDLPKAMGLVQGAGTIGMVLAPALQLGIMKLGYPGIPFLFGTSLNLYTVPVFISISLAIIGTFLIIFCFDGKMRIRRKDIALENVCSEKFEEKELMEVTTKEKICYDKLAVAMCMFTQVVMGLVIIILTTVMPPHSMMVFEWTSEQAVLWSSIGTLMVGFCIITTIGSYVCCRLGQRVASRDGIIFSLIVILIFFTTTYPWSFYGKSIPYKHPRGVDSSNFTITDLNLSDDSLDLVGCPLEYKWCETTPPIHFISYFVVSSLAFGTAMPILSINLNVLFSQILGPIKQGTIQGIFNAVGIIIQIVAPIGLSKVYAQTGVIYIWQFIMAVILTCGILWLIFYKRMISYKTRKERFDKESSMN